ncbi:SusD family protein [Chitinophaga sp. YR627]|uniref:RagB/SusD family nutrient uptake outer membrane protein n=1 Tax=Chitinophaga sp. YR627 TaxID=1881041 RepID=UPI0008EE1556|nr:RagB/SusD family nutrient uptake outer membrane protein [Chitinophaga sp. YR627]SFO26377.1 SusD family protein [Chitinophaga sp. YR627]
MFFFIFLSFSCKRFLDVGNPPDKVVADYVYKYDASANSVLTGIFFSLQQRFQGGSYAISTFYGLCADECSTLVGSVCYDIYTNNSTSEYWVPFYEIVYRANAAIEGLSKSTTLTPMLKERLIGEAKFVRAFIYFYLVNIYGDVPLVTTTDYKLNIKLSRAPEKQVYIQIINDLIDAQNLLDDEYLDTDGLHSSIERIRPNKWAATALLARVYLYSGELENAIRQSTLLIDNKQMFDTVQISDVFLKNNKEAIWQLYPVDVNGIFKNTLDAPGLVLVAGPDYFDHPVWMSDDLFNSIEKNDLRKKYWIGVDSSTGVKYNFFYKYKLSNADDESGEYFMVLRLAEQYLIRAEARVRNGDIPEGLVDLNLIRRRAGLKDIEIDDTPKILTKILHERQVEMFMEWGHRWFDLKRLGYLDNVMSKVADEKGSVWYTYRKWDAIPTSDLLLNSNLKQNEGYPSP